MSVRGKAVPVLGVLAFLLFVAWPIFAPFLEAFRTLLSPAPVEPPSAPFEAESGTVGELARLGSLTRNTLVLAAGALAFAVPLGTLLGLVLFRTDVPGRRLLLGAVVFSVFVPLPLLVSSWQALAGSDGLLPLDLWAVSADRPWAAGMLPAIWVHGLAGLPWVVLIVGTCSLWVERELEEETLLATGPWRVLWHVTLPRCRAGILAAAAWVAVQTMGEITVTDMLLVPTFAEEVHTQFTLGGGRALAQVLMLLVPALCVFGLTLCCLTRQLARLSLPLQLSFPEPLRFHLGRARWLALAVVLAAVVVLLLGPLAALVWKMGLANYPPEWSLMRTAEQFGATLRAQAGSIAVFLGTSCATGMVTACLALLAAWWAADARWRQITLLSAVIVMWVLPGPVVGIGVKQAIGVLVEAFPIGPVPSLLYHGPSPVPIVWAHVLRFFPFAVAILWPMVRLVPTELRDAARLEGAGNWQEFGHIYWPLTRVGRWAAALAVTALSLGEVGAAARVETPGWESFAKLLFDRMHYGVDREVASLGVTLLVGLLGVMLVSLALYFSISRAQTAALSVKGGSGR